MNIQNISYFSCQQNAPLNTKKNRFCGNNEENTTFESSIYDGDSIQTSNAIKAQLNVKMPAKFKLIDVIRTPFGYEAKMYELESGQKVVILPKKGPTQIKTYVKTGSMNEPDDKRGISHFIEHNLFNGTENLGPSEFFAKVNDMGAQTNASTSFAQTDYYIKSNLLNDTDLEDQIKIHADMLQNPKFAPEQLEKETGPVTSEIAMVTDRSENLAVNTCIKELYQINTTSCDLIAGTVDNINKLNHDDMVQYYQNNYAPENMVTVITGDVDSDNTIKLIAKYFNNPKSDIVRNRKFEDLKPIQNSIRIDKDSKDENVAVIAIGFAGPENVDTKGKIATELLLSMLIDTNTSNLNKELDKIHESINYSFEKIGTNDTDRRAIILESKVTPDIAEEYINKVFYEIEKFRNSTISIEELNRSKDKILSDISLISENGESINSIIGDSLLSNDLAYITDYENILASISPEDIHQAADKFLDISKSSLCVMYPKDYPKEKIEENYNMSNRIASISRPSFCGSNVEIKSVYSEDSIKQMTLSNNIELAVNPTKVRHSSYIINFDASIPYDKHPSASIVLSVMLDRSTKYMTNEQLEQYKEANNILTNAVTSSNSITLKGECLDKNFDSCIDLSIKNILEPGLTQKEFEWSKRMILNELSKIEDTREFNEALFPNLPDNVCKEKLIDDLKNLKLEDVQEFYDYIMNNAQVSATFSLPCIENPELLNKTLDELNELPKFKEFCPKVLKTFEPIETPKIFYVQLNNQQAQISQSYKAEVDRSDIKEFVKLELLNTILGGSTSSRLFNDLREKQKLAYHVSSNVSYVGNTAVLTMNIGTTTDDPNDKTKDSTNINKSIEGFNKHVDMLKRDCVSQRELENAKAYIKNIILSSLEMSNNQTVDIESGLNSPNGVYRANEILKVIDLISVEDIRDEANIIFKDACYTNISASKKSIEEYKESIGDNKDFRVISEVVTEDNLSNNIEKEKIF